MKKRGLSSVVATLLLILLGLAGATGIYIAVKSFTSSNLDNNENQVAPVCYALDYKVDNYTCTSNGIISLALRNTAREKIDSFIIEDYTNKKVLINLGWLDLYANKTFLGSPLISAQNLDKIAIIPTRLGNNCTNMKMVINLNCIEYADNILKNGDFEYGLQCFNIYNRKNFV